MTPKEKSVLLRIADGKQAFARERWEVACLISEGLIKADVDQRKLSLTDIGHKVVRDLRHEKVRNSRPRLMCLCGRWYSKSACAGQEGHGPDLGGMHHADVLTILRLAGYDP
jgi:hypothetical protein